MYSESEPTADNGKKRYKLLYREASKENLYGALLNARNITCHSYKDCPGDMWCGEDAVRCAVNA